MNIRPGRASLLGALALTLVIGLLSRSQPALDAPLLPDWLKAYAGDSLWAIAVYWAIAFLKPDTSIRLITATALVFCFTIELSQLCRADWLLQLRSYRLGGWVLGHGFLWSDLLCYSIGILFAASTHHLGRKCSSPPCPA